MNISNYRIKSIRGKDNKISENFSKELNKWALESIAYLALNRRLGCLQGNLSDDSAPAKMIRLAEDVFTYSAKLDFQPSPWKYIATPTFKKTMKLYDEQTTYVIYNIMYLQLYFMIHTYNSINHTYFFLFFSMIESLVKDAIKKINEKEDNVDANEEPSVLEKLLKVNEKVAIVMSIDMVGAGVDTVIFQIN